MEKSAAATAEKDSTEIFRKSMILNNRLGSGVETRRIDRESQAWEKPVGDKGSID
jgi:hypothetical protein